MCQSANDTMLIPLYKAIRILHAVSTFDIYMVHVPMSPVQYEQACRACPCVPHGIYDDDDRLGGVIIVSVLPRGGPSYDAVTRATHAWLLAALGEQQQHDMNMDLLRACCHAEILFKLSDPGVVASHRPAYDALKALVPSGVVANPGWMPLQALWNWASSGDAGCSCSSCGRKFESILNLDGIDDLLTPSRYSATGQGVCPGCALHPSKRSRRC